MSDISLLQLPIDVLVIILKHMSYSDVRRLMLTCKTLRDVIVSENYIWRSISRRKLVLHNSSDNRHPTTQSWYNKCCTSHHWCKGIYESRMLLYHQTNYMPWLKFHNSQVLLLSVGSELHCFPTDKNLQPKCKRMLWKLQIPTVKRYDVRTNDISRFVVQDGYIVCGNRDGCAAVYTTDNMQKKPRLLKHLRDCHVNGQVEVSAVDLVNSKHRPCVVTASDSNSSLCFWLLNPESNDVNNEDVNREYYRCESVVSLGDNVGTRCLAMNSIQDKLAVGLNGICKPVLIDVTTGQLELASDSWKNIKHAVRDVFWHNENTVVFVTHSGVLQMLDIRSRRVVYDVMDPFQSTLYCVKSDGRNAILVGSSENSRCVLFDSRLSARHVQIYFTQKRSSPVYSLDFDATKLIAAADRSVAVLNFNTGSSSVLNKDYSDVFELINR